MKTSTLIVSLIALTLSVFLTGNWRTLDYLHEKNHDLFHENNAVESRQSIEQILNNFQQLKFEDLSAEYRKYTRSDRKKYKGMLKGKQYYSLKRRDLNKRIVGRFRIKDFMPQDKFYKASMGDDDVDLYWLMDKKLLFALLELQDELDVQGYDKQAFEISNAHRHPRHNEKIGGASKSHHIKGEAIDLLIGDINADGKYSKKDKDIVLKICNEKVIGNKGGIGRYPGTRTVHIDVRGKRARWDSF